MEILIFILFIINTILSAFFCGKVVGIIRTKDSLRRSWLGLGNYFTGIIYVILTIWALEYKHAHMEYNYDEYQIVNRDIPVIHDNQIDTIKTFKIVKK